MLTSILFPNYYYCEIRKQWAHPDIEEHFERFHEAQDWLMKHGATMMEECEDEREYGDYYNSSYFIKFTDESDMLAFALIFSELVVR